MMEFTLTKVEVSLSNFKVEISFTKWILLLQIQSRSYSYKVELSFSKWKLVLQSGS